MYLPLQFIIQGAVGFAIGAGTNELAIRWVFWALFAKKKREIADAVQKVVSEELMSPEKIARQLDSPEVTRSLHDSLLSAIDKVSHCSLPSLEELAARYAEMHLDSTQEQLASLITDVVSTRFAEADFRTGVLRPFLDEQWRRLKPCRPVDLLPAHTRDLVEALPERLAVAVLAEEHRQHLCEVIEKGLRSWMAEYPTPSSFLGPMNTAELARVVGSRTGLIGDELAGLLATAPAQSALCEAIRTAVHSRIGNQGMIGSILSGLAGASLVETQLKKFCETLPDAVRKQFSDDGDSDRMRRLIESAVCKLAERTWGELLDVETPEALRQQIHALLSSDAVRDMTSRGFASITASVLDNIQSGTLGEASSLMAANDDVSVYLDWLAETLQRALCSPNLHPQLLRQTQQAVVQLCKRPIGALDRSLPENAKRGLATLLADQVVAFVRGNVTDLVQRTRIWDIISESIIVYDEKRMEKIVRSVANRELRWVTLLGGVIGLVVGIAQGIILLLLEHFT